MSQQERFDIFNEQMIKIGVDTRANVHARGLWHQTFHCWVLNNSKTEILLQLRQNDKDTYPGLLDISCAGHLLSGETVEDGVRELEEELGISSSFEELIFCGMVAQENLISSELIDREFNHVFLLKSNKAIEDFNFQLEEISGLFYVSIIDFKKLLYGDIDSFWISGIVIDEVNQLKRHDKRKLQKHNLTPNSNEYYDLLFEKIDNLY